MKEQQHFPKIIDSVSYASKMGVNVDLWFILGHKTHHIWHVCIDQLSSTCPPKNG